MLVVLALEEVEAEDYGVQGQPQLFKASFSYMLSLRSA